LDDACGHVCTEALESLRQLRHASDDEMKHSVSTQHCSCYSHQSSVVEKLNYKPLHVIVV